MIFAEVAVIAVYISVAIRCFSYGVYGLKNGNAALFAVSMLLIAASGVLLALYIVTGV